MKELTKDQAIALFATKWWETKTDREIAEFQLFNDTLCMPFARFHEAVEKSLGRSVWTHEFANPDALRKELFGERSAPTSFEQILSLIPAEKLVIVKVKP